jgi:hypothetical protein
MAAPYHPRNEGVSAETAISQTQPIVRLTSLEVPPGEHGRKCLKSKAAAFPG